MDDDQQQRGDRATRARHTPPAILPILERLGIDRFNDPWIWVTTSGLVTTSSVFTIYDGGPRRTLPIHPEDAEALAGFSYELLGVRVAHGDRYYGLCYPWESQTLDVRYIRVRWQSSLLFAEYTATLRERGAVIGGAHLEQHSAEDRRQAWAAMDLIFEKLRRGPKGPSGPRKGSDVERWVDRAREIGKDAALAEFKSETPKLQGEWDARYQWWWRNVRPHLQRMH